METRKSVIVGILACCCDDIEGGEDAELCFAAATEAIQEVI